MTPPETIVTTYVVVPIRVWCLSSCEGVLDIDWSDDGEPGVWGDTYDATGDGTWTFDPLAQQAALKYVRDLLSRVAF